MMSRIEGDKFLNLELLVKGRFSPVFIAFIAGALLPLAFAPVDLKVISFLSPLVLYYVFSHSHALRAAWLGWWFGLGFFLVGVSWVFVAIHIFGFTDFITSILLTSLFVSFLAGCFAIQGYGSAWLIQHYKIDSPFLILVIVLPVFWVLLEWFRGWFMTGFPWLLLGYSQTDTFMAGYASSLGVYGISWLVAVCAGLVLLALSQKQLRVTAVSIFVAIWLIGYVFQQVEWTKKSGKEIAVSLIQGNAPQITKWDPHQFELRKSRYLSLTRQHWDSDLILWPENSLTLFYHQMDNSYLNPLAEEAKKNSTDIILGLPFLNEETDQYYSSFLRLGDEPQFYHKSHLVPFGEYIPLGKWLRGLVSFFDLPMSGFTAGSKTQPALVAAGQKIAPTICYEDTFGEELIRFLPEASLIINGSNNAWYGDSFAPHQHLQISRMRSLETGRDLLRVTTNGISAIINHKGELIKRSPQFVTHVLTGKVQPRNGATLYVRWGNTFILSLLLLLLAGVIVYSRRKN